MAVHATFVLFELALFATLLLISEMARRCIRRLDPDAEVLPVLLVISLLCAWWGVSVTLGLLNKWALSFWLDSEGVVFPVLFAAAGVWCRSFYALVLAKVPRRKLKWPQRTKEVVGIGLVGLLAGAESVVSSLSLSQVSLSLCTILRSAYLLFVLIIAVAAQLERCSFALLGALATLAAGVYVAAHEEASIYIWGVAMAIGAEYLAALRWLAVFKLLRPAGLDVVVILLCMAPSAMFSSLCGAVADEADKAFFPKEPIRTLEYVLLLLASSLLGFLSLLLELRLVTVAPVLVVSAGGLLKSAMTVPLAWAVFREHVGKFQWYGLLLTSLGTLLFSWLRREPAPVDALHLIKPVAALPYEALPARDVRSLPGAPSEPCEKPPSEVHRTERRKRPSELTELDSVGVAPMPVTPQSPVCMVAQQLKQELVNLERAATPKDSLPSSRSRRTRQGMEMDLLGEIEEQPPVAPSTTQNLNDAKAKLAKLAAQTKEVISTTTPSTPSSPATPFLSRTRSPREAAGCLSPADASPSRTGRLAASVAAAAAGLPESPASPASAAPCPSPTAAESRGKRGSLAASLAQSVGDAEEEDEGEAALLLQVPPTHRKSSLAAQLPGAASAGRYESVPQEPCPTVIGAV